MNKFFEALQKKIEISPSRSFDGDFWNKFNAEFGKPSLWTQLLQMLQAKPAFSLSGAAVVAALLTYGALHMGTTNGINSEAMANIDLLSKKEMIADLSLLSAFDKLPTSDEEWDILLTDDKGKL